MSVVSDDEEGQPGAGQEPGPVPAAPVVSPGSALGQVRARRRELRSERTKVFVIPGYGAKLAARYKPVDYERTMEIRRGAAKRSFHEGLRNFAELYAEIDTLASGCVEVVVKDPDHQQADEDGWVGIDCEHGPVRFEQHLAELLDFAGQTNGGRARMVVLELFPSEGAIEDHFMEVSAWMDNPFLDETYDEETDDDAEAEPEDERELTGESVGSAPPA